MYNQDPMHVLLVDDEPVIRLLLSRTLAAAGCLIETAESGEQALEIAGTKEFDLMITDCLMPGMSGPSLTAAFLEMQPQARVILMTGNLSPEIAATLEREEVIGWLQKPFSTDEVLDMLDQARG